MTTPPRPPPGAWSVTVYFTPASAQPAAQARQAARLAANLLRRAARSRPAGAVYLAHVTDPAGTIRTIAADAEPEPAGDA